MCGILATIPEYPDQKRFSRCLDQLDHRGPDHTGIFHQEDHRFSFGHKRLKILDLEDRSNQPYRAHNHTIIFNGEIYNYLELKEELQVLGYQFETTGDTEVLCAALNQWGVDCLNKLNGMWAFVAFDHRNDQHLISRDRFGQKPLYYSKEGTMHLFASEMKPIMGLRKSNSIANNFHHITDNPIKSAALQPLVQEIDAFPAGHWARIRSQENELSFNRYYEPDKNDIRVPKTYQEQVEAFRSIFHDACTIRLRSDVQVGTALSGGVDSSAILAQISDAQGLNNHQTFTASFQGSSIDETNYALEVSEHFSKVSRLVSIESETALQNIEKDMATFEHVYLTPPSPMVQLYQQMKAHGITVSLDGHGADELLGGYKSMFDFGLYDVFPSWTKTKKIIQASLRAQGIEANSVSPIDVYRYVSSLNQRQGMTNLGGIKHALSNRLSTEGGLLKQVIDKSLFNTSLPVLLRNYDYYSMAAGVESRMPFLDYRLVAYCRSLPIESLFMTGYSKAILRSSVEHMVPKEVLYRTRKVGFNAPFHEWINTPKWRTMIMDIIHAESFKSCPTINDQDRDTLIKYGEGSVHDYTFVAGSEIWISLNKYLWYEHFYRPNAA